MLNMEKRLSICLISIFAILSFLSATLQALPLSTDSRWIVDEKGHRVKLACVNWASHLDLVVAEGLNKQPVDAISKKIRDLGFNCVRLTWPIHLATNGSLASLTVRQSFHNAGLDNSIVADIEANNPSIVDLSLINAFQAVVTSLSKNKVMVILDNHISKPGWCCSLSDGNGFFGDQYFDPEDWIKGLSFMANRFRHNPYVVGMSLRNELRGPRENVDDWYRYMQRGAEAVHKANPNVLVILSGLNFDSNLTFIEKQPVNLSFTGKLVFEVHQYAFSNGMVWTDKNIDQVCGNMTDNLMKSAGFLLDQGHPLFLSEWGLDISRNGKREKWFLNCISSWMVKHDLDWALWTLTGNYYLRKGKIEMNEPFGLLDPKWTHVRNKLVMPKISVIQPPLHQGPVASFGNKHKIIFHPSTGLCILPKPGMKLQLGNCFESNRWTYTPQNTLESKGAQLCLKARGLNLPASLSTQCGGEGTSWAPISDSKLHLATVLSRNSTACLDVDSRNNVITTPCKCLSEKYRCDPESQWFQIANVSEF